MREQGSQIVTPVRGPSRPSLSHEPSGSNVSHKIFHAQKLHRKPKEARREERSAATMASLSFAAAAAAVNLRRPDVTSDFGNRQRTSTLVRRKRLALSLNAAGSTEPSSAAPEKPEIELEFIGPKPGADGSYPVDKAKAVSGEKLLRNIMNENKIELYATYGKAMNCGGGGSCGTCIVEVCTYGSPVCCAALVL
ncbi:hypothetical protein EUGRSUZ_C02856 [Eucalyptus grandis]|uniref:2Fe-2S ferredoxin-type domain-containing protein n=2 Tax=Eucalyptus grandis TaxID=71139 RepID=A0A059CU88_EUCGR|nr:hypothetical protein EUGRSUZ_C02856 [Eucalyptus grandis]